MNEKSSGDAEEQHVVVVGPDGQPMGTVPASVLAQAAAGGDDDRTASPASPTWSSSPRR